MIPLTILSATFASSVVAVATLVSILVTITFTLWQFFQKVKENKEKRSKMKKALDLKELIATRNDLEKILEKTEEHDQKILFQKLESMLSDIDKEINNSDRVVNKFETYFRPTIAFFLTISTLLFNDLSSIELFSDSKPKYISSIFSFLGIMVFFIISQQLAFFFDKKFKLNNKWVTGIILLPVTYIVIYLMTLYLLSLFSLIPFY